VNEEYFRAQGMNPDGTPLSDNMPEDMEVSLSDDLDAEYFNWKDTEDTQAEETDKKKKGGIGSIFGIKR
ncbi:MAG: hypothetical protein K5644_04300, partial [Lachnospiraceae bacterium]|nr:hypothetical protein [Lachnospiraceae bacterium]